MKKLELCPFCGSRPKTLKKPVFVSMWVCGFSVKVYCSTCKATIDNSRTFIFRPEKESGEDYNKRVTIIMDNALKEAIGKWNKRV